jgi:hypothetical protein
MPLVASQRGGKNWLDPLADGRRSAATHVKSLKTLVADAVLVQPVSATQFPANRENIREFSDWGRLPTATPKISLIFPGV